MKTPAATWKIGLALTLVYLSWGTTYLAIKEGVKTLPPGLFGGVRVGSAGLVLLTWVLATGQWRRLGGREIAWLWLLGAILFVGGNGLISAAQKTVPSGMASVLVATTPLWIALLEAAAPRGDRLHGRGWVGLLLGLVGVSTLWLGRAPQSQDQMGWLGPFMVLGSALAWALGSVVQRHWRYAIPHLQAAALQMILGGASLALLGVSLGEARELTPAHFTSNAVLAFFYLLVVGSLIGFVAYSWLLNHVSAVVVGTYAYVNPVVAILIGWLFSDEALGASVVSGMCIILAGVGLVRSGGTPDAESEPETGAPCQSEEDSDQAHSVLPGKRIEPSAGVVYADGRNLSPISTDEVSP
jgi:drug/metabolite transporter (DMT)-like permease